MCSFRNFADLSVFMNKLMDKWMSLRDQEKDATLKNDTNLLLLDSKVYSATRTSTSSYQIKIWFTLFEGSRSMVVVFSDTTQMRLIHRLQDQDSHKSRLLASVSHELRTPLNSSINLLETVIASSDVPEKIRENLLVPAVRSNQLLLNIVNDILDFSELQTNRLQLNAECREIMSTVDEAIQLMELQARLKGLQISREATLSNTLFVTDHTRLKQILLNLLSNAVKFTVEGYIKVIVSDYCYSQESSGDRTIQIRVEDSGIGILESDKVKLYSALNRANGNGQSSQFSGVGLGLMISNSLAKRLGPRTTSCGIAIESTLHKGSIFSFLLEEKSEGASSIKRLRSRYELDTLLINGQINDSGALLKLKKNQTDLSDRPTIAALSKSIKKSMLFSTNIMEAPRVGDTSMSLPNEKGYNEWEPTSYIFSVGKSLTKINRHMASPTMNFSLELIDESCACSPILIVDDDSFNILAWKNILEALNFEMDYAYNGKEAIEKAVYRAQTRCCRSCRYYQIIFMDCTMPVLNGFDATRILKSKMAAQEIPSTPIVACTALVQASNMQEALDAGMDDYCTKPISKAKVSEILKEYHLFK